MMRSFILILALSPVFSHATTAVVEKTKGNKALVSFPSGTTLVPGTLLYTNSKKMRPRRHYVEFSAKSIKTKDKVDIGSGSLDSSSDSSKLDLTYGWNTGTWMPWASLAWTQGHTDTTKTKGWGLGGGLNFNFIKNEPGQDLVPYASVGALLLSTDYYGTSSQARTQGLLWDGGIGALWYPFGELVALDVSYHLSFGKLDISGSETGKDQNSISGISFGTVLSF